MSYSATPWTAAQQASLSVTNSWSLPKLMSIELVMLSNYLILCHPLLHLPSVFPSIRVFSNESLFASGGQSIGVSASTSVFPMNTRDWSSLGWTGWISLQSKGLSRVFSNTTVQKHQFFSAQLSLQSNSHIHTWLLFYGLNKNNKGKSVHPPFGFRNRHHHITKISRAPICSSLVALLLFLFVCFCFVFLLWPLLTQHHPK